MSRTNLGKGAYESAGNHPKSSESDGNDLAAHELLVGRGGWQLERFFGSPVAWEFAAANSFLVLEVLTPSPQS